MEISTESLSRRYCRPDPDGYASRPRSAAAAWSSNTGASKRSKDSMPRACASCSRACSKTRTSGTRAGCATRVWRTRGLPARGVRIQSRAPGPDRRDRRILRHCRAHREPGPRDIRCWRVARSRSSASRAAPMCSLQLGRSNDGAAAAQLLPSRAHRAVATDDRRPRSIRAWLEQMQLSKCTSRTFDMYDLFIGNKNYSSWSLRPWVLHARAEHPVSRKPGALRRHAESRRLPRLLAHRQGALPGRRRHHGVGFAGHHRIPGRTACRCVAGRSRRARLGALAPAPRCIPGSSRCATSAR